jgi:hypothetical protein
MDRLLQHLQATGKVDENPRSGMPLNTTPREDRIIANVRGRRNRWPVASIFTVGPVKLNKDRPAGPVDILGPLGPATFVSSVSFNID